MQDATTLAPFPQVLRNIADDAAQLYGHTKAVIDKAIDHTPIRETVDKVAGFADRYKDILFGGINLIHAFLSPGMFCIGMAAGAVAKMAHRVGAIKVDPNLVTASNKLDYCLVTSLSILFLHTVLRGAATGFATGAYLASGYQGAMPSVQVQFRTAE